ncbi:phage holin family protein [Sciscionella sediminilitoris]|uniref:phage holin family protein n=1 Tax=Sciscionella sediminilitoris TaxID=1445613 RepID=UPI0004DF93C6|nr:phage holin family protein [Sciscionella sp. SE31]
MPESGGSGQSIGELGKQLRDELTVLVRDELALAKRELAGKARRGIIGGILCGAGGALGFYGGGGVIAGITVLFESIGDYWQAPLFIGVVLLGMGGALGLVGIQVLRGIGSPLPERTVDRVQRDIETVTGRTRPGPGRG